MSDDYKTSQEIIYEQNNTSKSELITPVTMYYPYLHMQPEQLENLAYYYFSNTEQQIKQYNKQIDVKAGKKVSDKGQDVTLFNKSGNIIGIVQCKRYQNKVNKTLFYGELTKTILYLIKDNIYTKSFKKYFIISPIGIDSDLNNLISDFPKKINHKDIDKAAKANINGKPKGRLSTIDYDAIKNKLISIIKKLTIVVITATELDTFLNTHPDICKSFFIVNSVIDIESHKKINNELLKQFKKIIQDLTNSKTTPKSINPIYSKIYNSINTIITHLEYYDKKLRQFDFNDEYDSYYNNFVKPIYDNLRDLQKLINTQGVIIYKVGIKSLIDKLLQNEPEMIFTSSDIEIGEYVLFFQKEENFNIYYKTCKEIQVKIENIIK